MFPLLSELCGTLARRRIDILEEEDSSKIWCIVWLNLCQKYLKLNERSSWNWTFGCAHHENEEDKYNKHYLLRLDISSFLISTVDGSGALICGKDMAWIQFLISSGQYAL